MASSEIDAKLVDSGLEILDEDECLRLLRMARVGRVAITIGAAAAILPVNFVMVGGDIMFFTGPGTKLDAARAGSMVSFEADEVDADSCIGWSVLAVGRAELTDGTLRPRVEALGLCPWAAGQRHDLVRIRPTFLSGRRIAD
jgi:nitroimidazol reductase NimA-like FMN-containing flavoprotein (pyridoxamine 5'-phosphate oxidase superfamily)